MTRPALLIFLIAWTAQVWAQSFPSRPIHFAVAFAPGGIADTIARGIGQKMSERVGQPVVVETKSGAGGMVGAKYVAAAAPDGYTLLVTTTALAINANAPQGVNPLTELTPVAIAASTPTIFAVNGNVAAKDLMDFVRNVKGGRFSFASAGIGSAEHLAGEYLFRSVQGLEATHVPFQGGAPVHTATVSQPLNAEINHALGQADLRDRLSAIGLEPRTLAQPQFVQYMKEEVANWGRVIKATGITPH